MASSYSSTNPPNVIIVDEETLEEIAIESLGFKIWHVIFLAFAVFLALVILFCCCVKIRIPRTKQEIEADYQRKVIARKFRKRLQFIQNQEMDNMDLERALAIVQEEFKSEEHNLAEECDQVSIETPLAADTNLNKNQVNLKGGMKAEPQVPNRKGLAKKIKTIMKASALTSTRTSSGKQ